MTDRERIAAKIRALRAKTVENGCTEGEALAAAAKVAELLRDYNMTLDEAEVRASPFARHREQHEDCWVGERLWKPAAGISALTGATYWKSPHGVFPVEINFFGFAHEVEVAKYLLEICAHAMHREYRGRLGQYALLVPAARRRRILPFLDGMADRLHQRIAAMKPPAPTGRGLVVLRQELVRAAMADAGINLKHGRARRSRDFEDTYRDGLRAGDRVALSPGLQRRTAAAGLLR